MIFPNHFIGAGTDCSTLEHWVPAPYLKRVFALEHQPQTADLLITGLGFYDLYINGKRITKGALAPYISNPDHIVYYDRYEVADLLQAGDNSVAVCLGNGFQNNPGGYVWDFDKVPWKGAPRMALQMDIIFPDSTTMQIDSREGFQCIESPLCFDDFRVGEYYDARKEIDDWTAPCFGEEGWRPAVKLESPRGEAKLCQVPPIVECERIHPVSVTETDEGFLYDFGGNYAGVTRLEIAGECGQKVTMYHGETLKNGHLDMTTMTCDPKMVNQKDVYICRGNDIEQWQPLFTYHGFRYVLVEGITKEQAVPQLLTCITMNADIQQRGGFTCSDPVINQLQTMAENSTLGNFYYFPTDCPHREKNGWTGDAALSVEFMLLNYNVETSLKEWVHNICKAQADNGALPGIVPTGSWGYEGCTGPAWDCALTYIPYFIYQYRGDVEVLKESADSIFRYVNFITSKIREDGLICWGLGDWCHVGRNAVAHKSPNYFTDTIVCMDICKKAAEIFGVLNKPYQKQFAENVYRQIRTTARKRLLNLHTMTAEGNCQTSQAMAIFYGLFDPAEQEQAFKQLLSLVHQQQDHFDVGVLGARVLFHVLAEHVETELAYKMITRPDFPSYGWWVAQGSNTLWEDFHLPTDNPEPGCEPHSKNHHFWGDISHFFIRHFSGIAYNPYFTEKRVDFKPKFPKELSFAEGYYTAPEGRIWCKWERDGKQLLLHIEKPDVLSGTVYLPDGYEFEDGKSVANAVSGTYKVTAIVG